MIVKSRRPHKISTYLQRLGTYCAWKTTIIFTHALQLQRETIISIKHAWKRSIRCKRLSMRKLRIRCSPANNHSTFAFLKHKILLRLFFVIMRSLHLNIQLNVRNLQRNEKNNWKATEKNWFWYKLNIKSIGEACSHFNMQYFCSECNALIIFIAPQASSTCFSANRLSKWYILCL